MKLTRISKVESGQDIAIFAGYLFDFVAHGICLGEVSVYEMETIKKSGGEEPDPICRFVLDGVDKIIPHANAVFFSKEYYAEGDEFPILYANVYNNYVKCENRREGILLAYRIMREGTNFTSTLLQVIEIGFVEDRELWKSTEGDEDVRPYGNFILDPDKNILYAFVMRDKPNTTRYFSFNFPSVKCGEYSDEYGAKRLVLNKEDILGYFDTDYHKTLQGACCRGGIIYSLEGGTERHDRPNAHPAAIRRINLAKNRLSTYNCLWDEGVGLEPEGIDFEGDTCYYVAGHGDTYILEF